MNKDKSGRQATPSVPSVVDLPASNESCHEEGGQASSDSSLLSSGGQASLRKKTTDGDQASRSPMSKRVSLRYKKHSSSRCKICSRKKIIGYKTGKKYHTHFSSKFYRECCDAEDKCVEIYCPTCKKSHESKPSERLKVCVASSMLHEFWAPKANVELYEGDKNHIDYITIPGARINDLTVAWEISYINETRPMDVIIVGGLHDLCKGKSQESIMRAFKYFIDLVMWQGSKMHPGVDNTCAVSTFPYPPKLCWLANDGPCPSGYRNQIAKVKGLNREIERLNGRSGIKVPNLTTFGLRKATRGNYDITKHRWNQWQEEERKDKLFLKDELRLKTGRQIAKYFLH